MSRPVPTELQARIKQAYRQLLAATGGTIRRGQQEMIGAVARAVANARKAGDAVSPAQFAVIDAPTGSGKTFGYSLGAIPIALANDLRVVISVSTVALQEQLVNRDLKAIATVVDGMRVALAKGRSRFCCPSRMEQIIADNAPAADQAATLLARFDAREWSGDIDTLHCAPDVSAWSAMTNDRLGCAGRNCQRYENCPYYNARRAVEAANVIVVNHDLLLADIAAGNVILPKMQDVCLLVDEAHHFPESALASLAGGHALGDAQEWVRQAGSVMAQIRRRDRNGPCAKMALDVSAALDQMAGALGETRMAIDSLGRATECRDERRPIRFEGGRLPSWLQSAAEGCRDCAQGAHDALSKLLESLNGDAGEGLPRERREHFVSDVGRALGRMERLLSVWRLMAVQQIGDEPVAKWLEVKDGDLSICASPIGVGQYLRDALWNKVAASVHLSATLRSTGGFTSYLRESGLSLIGEVEALTVASPFDYDRQASLIVPKDAPSAKDAAAHTRYLIERLPEVLAELRDGSGALVLFSSWAQLREVAGSMPEWIKARMLSQDDMSRAELLALHEQAIRNGTSSYIFATASYEEGVDLRGRACELVVVSKLPFASPADPVAEALKEHLEAAGRSHFDEVVLPRACRRLAQATGRLIRSETDTGQIVVTDNRLTRTRYGREMIAALPPYRLNT